MGTVASIVLQQTTEPELGPDTSWDIAAAPVIVVPLAPLPTSSTTQFTVLQRFVRIRILTATGASDKQATISIEGIAREST